eukprot:COSAG02_NODE_4606_length_5172_cov_16.011037_1_plen_100_part_00
MVVSAVRSSYTIQGLHCPNSISAAMSSIVTRYQGAQQCPVSLGFKARSGVQYNTWSKLEAVSSILLGVTARSDQYHSVSQRAVPRRLISYRHIARWRGL